MTRFLVLLLALHVVLGAVRVPGVVFARRIEDVTAYERRGAPRFFLDTPYLHGAAAVEWIRANTPPDSAVLYRGDSKGAIEFVPGLIAPRLLVREDACPPEATAHAGRGLARIGQTSQGSHVIVIAALGDDLRIESR